MISYIIKTIACSGILLAAYYILFEKEKMPHFKRFYLLLSIVLSFFIPLLTFYTETFILPVENTYRWVLEKSAFSSTEPDISLAEHPDYLSNTLFIIYALLTLLLLFRFITNFNCIIKQIKHNEKRTYKNVILVLVNEAIVPHSFLYYIFIHKKVIENEGLEKEILAHEYAHVQQRHSLDILLIEFLQIWCWFNPFFILYNKAIRLNHEFLADEAVLHQYQDKISYQQILLAKTYEASGLPFSSQFNYSITKKRFIMMNRTKYLPHAIIKQLLLLPLFTLLLFLFSTKAQELTPIPPTLGAVKHTQEGVSQALLIEYQLIINKYKKGNVIKWGYFSASITKTDRDQLESIFTKMSKAQQNQQVVVFILPPSSPKVVPTQTQLDAWKDAAEYGVWIDEKRVNNQALNDYLPSDFAQVFVSKLMKNAKNYAKHVYQVDLITTGYYDTMARDTQNRMVYRTNK